jgi:AraC-like DNA-binding protein
MQRYSTRTLPRADKVAYWQALHRQLSRVLNVKPISSGSFEAECISSELGSLSLRHLFSAPARLEVTPETASLGGSRQFFLLMPVESSLRVRHNDIDDRVEPGDFFLIDTSLPSVVEFATHNQTISLGIPAKTLASHLPGAKLLAGIPIRGNRGIGYVASNMLRTIAAQLEHGLPPEAGSRLAHSLLEVIATSYLTGELVGKHGITRSQVRRLRAKRVIEAHLHDPRLSPAFIADVMQISARYLRMLFEEEGESVTRYVQRRRLEKCAEQLRASAAGHITLTDIAFSHGFSSMAHFSRLFREHFGMPAREYRKSSNAVSLDLDSHNKNHSDSERR